MVHVDAKRMHGHPLHLCLIFPCPLVGAVYTDVPPVGPIDTVLKDGDGKWVYNEGTPLKNPFNVGAIVITGVNGIRPEKEDEEI